MEKYNISLVIFTWLTQASVGLIFSFPSLNATIKNKNTISDVIFLTLAITCDFLNRVYALTFTDPAL